MLSALPAAAQFDPPLRRVPRADGPPVRVERVERDCHREPARHYLEEAGRRVWHYHRGPNCRVILGRGDEEEEVVEDCHREVRRHFIPGYGRLYHSHRGPRCRVVEYEVYREDRYDGPPPRDCVQIGPVRVCP